MGGVALRVGWKAANFPMGFVTRYVGFLESAFPSEARSVSADPFGWFSPLFPRDAWTVLLRAASRTGSPRVETLSFFCVPCLALPGAIQPQATTVAWGGAPLRVVGLQQLLSEWECLRDQLLPAETPEEQQRLLDAFVHFDDEAQLASALARALDLGLRHAEARRLPIWIL